MNETLLSLLKNSFGFDPQESAHHFLVNIPRSTEGKIEISEHFTWDEQSGSSEITYGIRQDGQVRAVLVRPKWEAIADEVRAQFNQRLRKAGMKPGAWRVGHNLLRRELGKELALLAWAIEDADPTLIATALANWNGLVPEERWWLYTQAAAATGHATADRGRGWRKALRYALTENPVTGHSGGENAVPEYFRRAEAGPLFNAIREPENQAEEDQSNSTNYDKPEK
jgi:hypothetical protein